MTEAPFIGRNQELSMLKDLLKKQTSSLVVIKGRRRIGKSRLIEQFTQQLTHYRFSGLAPVTGITAQNQKDEFALQLSQQTGVPEFKTDDWTKLLMLLADKCKAGRLVIVFDEITWLAHGDPTFLSKLKNIWDLHLKQNPKLILILCGSVSAWIEKNVLSSTGYFGRISLDLTLRELPLPDCNLLLSALGFQRSALEKLIYLTLSGGVPWYIEQINPTYSAADNIKQLCFNQNALLVNEFKHIFNDLFGTRNQIYQNICELIAEADMSYDTIADKLNYAKGTALSDYLEELITCGYVTQYRGWTLKTGKLSPKLLRYRLSDNFLRFYFRYMLNKVEVIKAGNYAAVNITELPGWQSMLGLQFENLMLANRQLIHQELSINPADIIANGPYFQRKTTRQSGCQIDYLIQTKYNTLFACEVKFSQQPIGTVVIKSMKEKLSRLTLPRGFALLPVLIHAGEVTNTCREQEYFFKIIDINQILSTE